MVTFLLITALASLIGYSVPVAQRWAISARPTASVYSGQGYMWRVFAVGLFLWGEWRDPLRTALSVWTVLCRGAGQRSSSLLTLLMPVHTPHRAFALSCCLLD